MTLNKSTEINKINEIKLEIENKNPFYIEHIETNNEYIYKKRIKGNIFTIFNQEVENISITYIKISHLYERFQKYLKLFCINNTTINSYFFYFLCNMGLSYY